MPAFAYAIASRNANSRDVKISAKGEHEKQGQAGEGGSRGRWGEEQRDMKEEENEHTEYFN